MSNLDLEPDPTIKPIIQELDESLDALDYATRSKLQQARQTALEKVATRSPLLAWHNIWQLNPWSSATLVIAIAITAILITPLNHPAIQPETSEQLADASSTMQTATPQELYVTASLGQATGSSWFSDLELLAAEEELEFIEDLEFYEWLQHNAENTRAENILES